MKYENEYIFFQKGEEKKLFFFLEWNEFTYFAPCPKSANYCQLTKAQKYIIQILKGEGFIQSVIALMLGKDKLVLSPEYSLEI